IVTHPKTKDFYEGVLCFRPLSNEIKTCGHVNNALGIAQVLDLTSLKDNFFQIYHDNPQHRNIHDFYFVRDFSNFFFLPKFSSILTSSMPDSYFRALFSKSASTIKELSNRDNIILSGLYGDFVAQLGLLHIQNLRMRTLTSISGTLCAGNNLLPVRVLDVSSGGAKIISKHPLPTDLSPLVLAISRPQHPPLQIPIRVVWSKNQRVAGVQIKNPLAGEWLQWTEGLRRQFQRSMLSRVA
ncbi:MAG: PilZ domain-containing protein, partial [Bdellovibrionales bacterium]|nr:PilZ domain-containing protein [Bdellovibrionales bacterium]